MSECWMYGKDAVFDVRPICDCCQREVDRVRTSMWHGADRICVDCFIGWYDPSEAIDVTNPIAVGNYVRKKHGLPPLTTQETGDLP